MPLCPSCLLAMALATADEQDDVSPENEEPPYDIVTILARDADAVTYLAHPHGSSEPIALKIIAVPRPAAVVSRFREWKARLSHVRHAGIAQLVDVGSAGDGHAYIATEYIAGSSLDAVLRRGTLTPVDGMEVARQLADALSAAHAQGLAHMRLNPSRVKLATGAGIRATILGLGMSLIVVGQTPQPALDVEALLALCQRLGIDIPSQPYSTIASIRSALPDVA